MSPEEMAAVQTGKEQCNRLRTHVAQANCKIALADKYVRPTINKSSLDLFAVGEAQARVLAEKVDAGQMTQAEADLEMAQAISHVASEEQQRNTNANVSWAAWKSAQPQIRSCQTTGFSGNSTTICLLGG